MEKLKLGAQFYTLRDFTKTPGDFLRTMHRIADIGYKYVQVSGVGPDVKADVIKKACDDATVGKTQLHWEKFFDAQQ